MVYGREADGRALSFVHSGKLWRDALVLQDGETGSLWSQVTGRAIDGPLAGAALDSIPSERTIWRDWRAAHPDTLVAASAKGRRMLRMRLYPEAGFLLGGLGTDNPDPRLPGKTLVAGFGEGEDAVAVALEREPWPQEARIRVGGQHLVVRHEGLDGPTRAWRTDGPPAFRVQEAIPAPTLYWFVWAALHPGSEIVHDGRMPERAADP